MNVPKPPSLDFSDWIDRHRRTTRELQRVAPGVEAMHQAIDCACPEHALELMRDADALEVSAAELDWVRCRALWENSRWDEVRALAESIPTGQLCDPLHLRVLIRAAWTDLLRAELDGDFIASVERLRPWAVQGSDLSHIADLAHLDAYRLLVFDDDPTSAAQEARLAVSLYARLGECSAEIKSRIFCTRLLAIEGSLAAAHDEARACVEAARRAGHPRLLVQALNVEATVAWRRGDWADAEQVYEVALRLAEEFEDERWKLAVAANRARLHAFCGRVETARRVLDQLDSGSAAVAAVIEEYRGQVALLAGDAEAALGHFDAALRRLVRDGVRSYERSEALLRKAEALLALEDYVAAEACAEEGLERLSRYAQTLERGHLLHARARCRVQRGQPQAGLADYGAAVAELRRVGDRWTLLRCLLDRADCPSVGAHQAVSDATEARALAARMGIEPLADRARRALVRAEARLHRIDVVVPAAGIVAECPAMKSLIVDARMVGASGKPVLLQGETGTGKEVFARFVHESSPRKQKPFVAVNCSAIPESLFEREVFGHARGAFTGAHRESPGLVAEASGGTLFLDEVGELPVSLQPKLLRLLQEGSYRKVGESRSRIADLRIVSATNRPLRESVALGRFRDDLFYRLSGFELRLPPLRERPEDLTPLVLGFLRRELGPQVAVHPQAWQAIRSYSWPGNVRELETAIGAACVRAAGGGIVREEHLPDSVHAGSPVASDNRLDLTQAVRRTERELILEALARARYRRTEAAQLLGIGRNTLYEKMRRLGIAPQPHV
jgi:two-component system response regulator HydG